MCLHATAPVMQRFESRPLARAPFRILKNLRGDEIHSLWLHPDDPATPTHGIQGRPATPRAVDQFTWSIAHVQ